MHTEVAVIGAGAAGILAATRAAERGKKTLLFEKNRRAGVKILISGGTRCNLTHDTDAKGIVAAYGTQGKFLHSALAALGPRDVVAMVEAEGVPTKVEATGKIFPVSDKSQDVLAALLTRLDRSGAILLASEPLWGIEKGFGLKTSERELTAGKVILTVGGQSYPEVGTTGDGYKWARDLGHTIVPPRPALAPLASPEPWIKALAGVTLPDIGLKVLGGDLKPLESRRGSLLFTHTGLSGPAPMDASRAVTGPASVELDLLPDVTEAALDELFRREAAASGKRHALVFLAERLPRRVAETAFDLAAIPTERKLAELSKAERGRLVGFVKRLPVPATGNLGWSKAEVTAGGVSRDEVDSRTMESKLVPGLFFAGEILDLDGPIGGYNFQAAFSTGWLAGGSV